MDALERVAGERDALHAELARYKQQFGSVDGGYIPGERMRVQMDGGASIQLSR